MNFKKKKKKNHQSSKVIDLRLWHSSLYRNLLLTGCKMRHKTNNISSPMISKWKIKMETEVAKM